MKILHKYVLKLTLNNLINSLVVFTLLFLTVDFIDRIDNILREDASIGLIVQYFILKIPHFLTLVMPIAMLITTLFTVGLLSKKSELTAMRASGLTVRYICLPLICVGFIASLFTFLVDQTVVPYSNRRVKEIYNLDIRKKDSKGAYNQEKFWWREGNSFYGVDVFDSRTNSLHGLTILEVNSEMDLTRRTDATITDFYSPKLKWGMHNVEQYSFMKEDKNPKKLRKLKKHNLKGNVNIFNENSAISHTSAPKKSALKSLPLLVTKVPKDFYDITRDPDSMSYSDLKRFIKEQSDNGISSVSYLPDLFNKLSFPFASTVMVIVVAPFAVRPARSGSMAKSVVISFLLGFSYYTLHSLSVSLGRAELLPAFLSAILANVIFTLEGIILLFGADSPH